jgi:hypothetical protein
MILLFLQREQDCLIIWTNDVNEILELCQNVETKLDEFIEHLHKQSAIPALHTDHQRTNLKTTEQSFDTQSETGQQKSHRPLVLLAPIYTGLAIALAICITDSFFYFVF